MPVATAAFDVVGSVAIRRRGAAAWRATSPVPMLAVMADIRTGLPGGADERDGGDAAVAFLCSGDDVRLRALAELVGRGAATDEFLDRWRLPGEDASHVWEERFGEHAYVPLARDRDQRRAEVRRGLAERARPRDRHRRCTAVR